MLTERYILMSVENKIRYRDEVEVQCERCGHKWTTTWAVYKNRKLPNDYCRGCKNSLGISGVKGGHSKEIRDFWGKNGIKKYNTIDVVCEYCGSGFERDKNQVGSHCYCSNSCRANDLFGKRYAHLFSSFKQNPDEVAYFVGLVFGDGGVKRSSDKTSRISITFGIKDNELICTAEIVLTKLNIKYSRKKRESCNVVTLNMMLPTDLISEYGLNIDGDKFRFQPHTIDDVIGNINFPLGLVNSDGYRARRRSGSTYIQITNTVESIVNDFCKSMDKLGFKYRVQKSIPRTRSTRKRYDVFISGHDQIQKFSEMAKYPLKKESNIL